MPKRPTQQEIHNNAVVHGWWDKQLINGQVAPNLARETIPEKIALIHSEASEALEEYRKGPEFLDLYFETGKLKPEGLIVELADAVIRCYDLAEAIGLDLDDAIAVKHEYNKSRPYRHGGKKA